MLALPRLEQTENHQTVHHVDDDKQPDKRQLHREPRLECLLHEDERNAEGDGDEGRRRDEADIEEAREIVQPEEFGVGQLATMELDEWQTQQADGL